MGLEAYRIGVRLEDDLSVEQITDMLQDLGATLIEKTNYAEVLIEKAEQEGYIEILLTDVEKRKELLGQGVRPDEEEGTYAKSLIYIQFSKPSAIGLVDKIIHLLQALNTRSKIHVVGMCPTCRSKSFPGNANLKCCNRSCQPR